MTRRPPFERVLGIYPCRKGFGFAAIERRIGLIDWGRAELSHDTRDGFRVRIALQMQRSAPAVLALEMHSDRRRGSRDRIADVIALAQDRSVSVMLLSAAEVRTGLGLSSIATRNDIVSLLCERYPELAPTRPAKSAWRMDPRMNHFHAAALAAAAIERGS